jgi:diguanylate cyclase (GGDEF)-like protein
MQPVSGRGGLWPFLLSAIVAAIALGVMVGWKTGSQALVQIHPSFAPMQFNTALCFLLMACASCSAGRRWLPVARSVSLLVVLISAATLAQYVVGRDFGIDQLLQQHYITTLGAFPGRMAHITSIAFILIGLSTCCLTLSAGHAGPRIAAEALAALVVSISLVAIVGYIAGVEDAYGWGQDSRMALHTAIGFLLIGLAILHMALMEGESRRNTIWRRAHVPLVIVMLTTSVSLWQALNSHEARRITDATDAARQSVEDVFMLHAGGLVRALERMGARWAADNGTPKPRWQADARSYLEDDFSLLGWMDREHRLVWSEPSASSLPPATAVPGLPQLAALCVAAVETRAAAVAALDSRSAKSGLLAAVPITVDAGSDGCIVAVSPLRALHESPVVDAARFEFSIVSAADGVRLAASTGGPDARPELVRGKSVDLQGTEWLVSAWPTVESITDLRSALPAFLLAFGIVATCLLQAVFVLYRVSAGRAAELAAQHAELGATKNELERLALYDGLTHIGNRHLFLRTLQANLASAETAGRPAALLVMDLNGFKAVNDQLGHRAGDIVLTTVAERLVRQVAGRGQAFRMGGDEFAIVLDAGIDQDGAADFARSIVACVADPIELYGERRTIGVSIGIAVFPRHGHDVDGIIRKADVAMYEAKVLGQPVVASLDMGATTVLRLKQLAREPRRG